MKRRHKYNAQAVHACPEHLVIGGGCCRGPVARFDSKGEYLRWCDLKLLERAGKLFCLKRQVPIVLEVNGQVVTRMVVDFSYTLVGPATVLEDFKGHATEVWKLRRKLARALGYMVNTTQEVMTDGTERSKDRAVPAGRQKRSRGRRAWQAFIEKAHGEA